MIECKLYISNVSEHIKCAQGYCKVSADSKLEIREELTAVLSAIHDNHPDVVYVAIEEFIRRAMDEQNNSDKHNSK